MKSYRFYEEFENKRRGVSAGTVVAALFERGYARTNDLDDYWYPAIGGVFSNPNSDVSNTQVSVDYLRKKCKRISERRARAIHPRLFAYLDREGD